VSGGNGADTLIGDIVEPGRACRRPGGPVEGPAFEKAGTRLSSGTAQKTSGRRPLLKSVYAQSDPACRLGWQLSNEFMSQPPCCADCFAVRGFP
jgi:hypothetical protein